MQSYQSFIFVLFALLHHPTESMVDQDRCTTIIVGPGAGTDGPMTTHTSDCSNCDFRINKVPARDWPKGTLRPLYLFRGEYPMMVTPIRGSTWHPDNLEGTAEQKSAWGQESEVTGYIPEVDHTYALYESGYGIMNEFQVGIGESTCAAIFWSAPVTKGGKAMIEAQQMTRIALERCKTAREAVIMMGDLATQYGFYAADWSGGDASKGEGGEALTVVDKDEAWVFHVMGDDTGSSAIWVAQRVPRGHVAAVANQFVIRQIDKYSPDFLFSENIFLIAQRNNLWKESDGKLDFLKAYAPQRAHSTYCTRRVWRVFNLVAPSLLLPAVTDALGSDYPFSVQVDRPLSPADMMRIQRDHYEGTAYDMTKGLASGPYGDPNRYDSAPQPADGLTAIDIVQGSFERSISLFRTSYSIVVTARKSVPDFLSLLWFCQYAPSSSSYTPLYIAATDAPATHSKGSLFKFDSSVAFWNFLAVGNYAAKFYRFAMVDVTARQLQLQNEAIRAVAELEAVLKYTSINGVGSTAAKEVKKHVESVLTDFSNQQALKITQSWQSLLYEIITKYHDGYIAQDLDQPIINMKRMFYPKYWLDAVGFFDSKINTGPNVILFSTADGNGDNSTSGGVRVSYAAIVLIVFMTMLISLIGGVYIGKRNYLRRQRNRQYVSIDI